MANKQLTTHNSPEDIAAEISSAASTDQGKGQSAEHPPVGPKPIVIEWGEIGPPINGRK